jgi:hypothetical protein
VLEEKPHLAIEAERRLAEQERLQRQIINMLLSGRCVGAAVRACVSCAVVVPPRMRRSSCAIAPPASWCCA